MAEETEFREPVFVRKDDTTTIEANVIIWNDKLSENGGSSRSVRIGDGNDSVLINDRDWAALVSCINNELMMTSEE